VSERGLEPPRDLNPTRPSTYILTFLNCSEWSTAALIITRNFSATWGFGRFESSDISHRLSPISMVDGTCGHLIGHLVEPICRSLPATGFKSAISSPRADEQPQGDKVEGSRSGGSCPLSPMSSGAWGGMVLSERSVGEHGSEQDERRTPTLHRPTEKFLGTSISVRVGGVEKLTPTANTVSIASRLVRSTSVPIADRFRPMMRSPSQWPGTARSSTSAGRSLIITSGVTCAHAF